MYINPINRKEQSDVRDFAGSVSGGGGGGVCRVGGGLSFHRQKGVQQCVKHGGSRRGRG